MKSESNQYHLAYVFERFPTFTQTFCVREIQALKHLGLRPLIFSIRDTSSEPLQDFPDDLRDTVVTLPQGESLSAQVKEMIQGGELPPEIKLTLKSWEKAGFKTDRRRVYEAAWIGGHLSRHNAAVKNEYRIHHAHCHFAGLAARTLWWLKKYFNLTYSFTAHANDVFEGEEEACHPKLKRLFDQANFVVTVSDYSRERLQGEYPLAAEKVHRVYNGMDVSQFSTSKEPPPTSQPFHFLSVGRLIEKKGFEVFIEACSLLPNSNWRATIIGEGPLYDVLADKISHFDLQDRVKLVGELPFNDVKEALHEAHCFVLACAREQDGGMDNLPTVIVEAMAASLPVISTPLAGVPEMVEEGHTGVLVAEGDAAALAQEMKRMMEDRRGARQKGEKGFQRADEIFDSKVTGPHLLHLFLSEARVACLESPVLVHDLPEHDFYKDSNEESLLFNLARLWHRAKCYCKVFNLRAFMERV